MKASGPKHERETIPCGYCFENWATVRDHLVPKSAGGSNSKSNLYPACVRCNALLSDKVFNSLEDKREYIRQELLERGSWRPGFFDALRTAPRYLVVPKSKAMPKAKTILLGPRCARCGCRLLTRMQRTRGYCVEHNKFRIPKAKRAKSVDLDDARLESL